MHKLLAAALLMVVAVAPALGQQENSSKKKIAVVDFEAGESLLSETVVLSKRLVRTLSEVQGYDVLSRKTTKEAIAKMAPEVRKFFGKPQAAAALAKALGVDLLVVPRLSKEGKTYILQALTFEPSTQVTGPEVRDEHTGTIVDALGLTDVLALKIAGTYDGPEVATGVLPKGRVGVLYNGRLELTPAKAGITWSVADRKLPAGLGIESGAITGIPEVPGEFTFTIRAGVKTEKLPNGVEKILKIVIKPAPLTFNNTELPPARLGHRYSTELKPPTGTPPFKWKLLGGSLPKGLTFNVAKGCLEGVPEKLGAYKIKVSVTDSIEPPETVSAWAKVTVTPAMQIVTSNIPVGYNGCEYKAELEAQNGVPPFTAEMSSGPEEFKLKGSPGVPYIEGRIGKTAVTSPIRLRLSDSTTPEPQVAERSFVLTVKGLHVVPVVTDNYLELFDIGVDRGGNPILLAGMKPVSTKSRWAVFCRWSGEDWTILPVTPITKGGSYQVLLAPDGPPSVLAYAELGSAAQLVLSVFTPSDQKWFAETVAAGRFHFLKARFDPEGNLLIAYERDRKLCLFRKHGQIWQEEVLVSGVLELTEFTYSPAGKAYFLYQDEKAAPMLLELTSKEKQTSKLPDYPRCAGFDSDGRLWIYSSSFGETISYMREGDVFKEAGRWPRAVSSGAVFSPSDRAAYSPTPRSKSWGEDRLSIACVSPTGSFSDLTFSQEELRASSYSQESLMLSVDRQGRIHAAFIASGLPRRLGKSLIYGRIGEKKEFEKLAKAKSFVRFTSQRELATPKHGPGRSTKSGSCALAPQAPVYSFAWVVALVLAHVVFRRRRFS